MSYGSGEVHDELVWMVRTIIKGNKQWDRTTDACKAGIEQCSASVSEVRDMSSWEIQEGIQYTEAEVRTHLCANEMLMADRAWRGGVYNKC